jgi:hypothetical protein
VIHRWTPSRKAIVAYAVLQGHLTLDEAAIAYNAALDEIAAWVERYTRFGKPGLRTTRTQHYRVAA